MTQVIQRVARNGVGRVLTDWSAVVRRYYGNHGGHGGPARRLDPLMSRLKSARHSTHRGTATLETQFLSIIEALETQSGLGAALVKESEVLLGFITGQQGGEVELKNALTLLAKPMGFLVEAHQTTSDLIERLKHHQDQMDRVRRHEGALHQTVAPLKFVQTLFRVESATLPHDTQTIFTGLTKDIENLQAKVTEIFAEQFQSLARARSTIQPLVARLVVQTAEQEKSSAEKEHLIRGSIEALQSDMAENQQRDVRLTRSSRSIGECVNRIVMGMQFQDITRQKMEHVLEAVDEILSRFERLGDPATGIPVEENLRFFREASRLQIDQLDAVLHELEQAEVDVKQGFSELATHAAEIDRECVTLSGFKSVSAAEDGMVQQLLNIIDDLRHLIAKMVIIQQEAYETIRPLGSLASNLTGVMRQLSMNIKLIALNAQIQAAQVGQGTGLEVLSERTSAISDEIYRLNEEVGVDLGGMVSGLERAVGEFRTLFERGQEIHAALREGHLAEEIHLHAYRDATLQAFMTVDSAAVKLDTSIKETLASIGFHAIAREIIDPLREALSDIHRVSTEETAAATSDDARLTHHLRENYTMASEQAVHAKGKAAIETAPPPSAAAHDFEFFSTGTETAVAEPKPAEPGRATTPANPPATAAKAPASVAPGEIDFF